MKKTGRNKLTKHLIALSEEEWTRFSQFVHSPYFNQRETLKRFLQVIRIHEPEVWDNDAMMHRELYGDEEFKSTRIRQHRSDLLKLIESFYVHESLRQDPVRKEKYLIDALIHKDLFKEAGRTVNLGLDELGNEGNINFKDAERAFLLLEAGFELNLRTKKRNDQSDFNAFLKSLDVWFLGRRLKLMVANENISNIIPGNGSYDGLWETLALVEKSEAKHHPLVKLYHHLLLIQTRPRDLYVLNQFYELITQYHQQIHQNDLYNIFLALVNILLLDLRNGIPGSLQRVFENYKRMHERGLFWGRGIMTTQLIRNSIATGARLKQFDWTRQFIAEARHHLDEEQQEQIRNFGAAHLAFHAHAYADAQKHLVKLHYEDPLVKISVDNLLLKCYFETQETEAFFSLQEALRRYIQRHKELSERYREGYQNFLNFVKYLYDLRWNLSDKYSIRMLRGKLEGYSTFFNRSWSNEQLLKLEL